MKRIMEKRNCILSVIIFILCCTGAVVSQNVAITDDDGYSAHSSAMLDVKSLDKGVLVPRLTTAQREAITSPATGLLVYDTDLGNFYFYNGGWVNLTSDNPSDLWTLSGSNVYLTNTDHDLGVGTTTPVGKLEVKGDADSEIEDPLFAVVNNSGDTVFAVYPEAVRIWVADDGAGKASKGGFAVGGFSSGKGVTNEYLRVTPDSVRVYIDDEFAKASKGGFAVGGFSSGKGNTDDYLFIEREQSRVYVDGDQGFAIGDINSGSSVEYLDLTPENYFIGHESGINTVPGTGDFGRYNTFLGYQTGKENTNGHSNVYIGYQTGMNATGGDQNVYIGREAGKNTTEGHENVFIGEKSGYNNTTGISNVFIGEEAGYYNEEGHGSVYIGQWAGYWCTVSDNSFIGLGSGYNNRTGINNTFVGRNSGYGNYYGENNCYFGHEAALLNREGDNNCVTGYRAGYGTNGETYDYNSIYGAFSGFELETGGLNSFFGYRSGYNTTTGYRNTFLGYITGEDNTTGDYNVYVGYQAGAQTTTGNNNTMIGSFAGGLQATGSVGGCVFIGYAAGYNESSSNRLYIDNSSTASPLIWGDFSVNRVVINGNSSSNPNNRTFYSNGTAGGDYAWYNDSDRRLKKNIATICSPIEKIMQLRGVNFEWKDKDAMEEGTKMGFIAQEAVSIIPEVVDHTGGKYSMQYAPITALLVEGMKEQQKIIEQQGNEIKYLKEELENIKSLLEASAKK